MNFEQRCTIPVARPELWKFLMDVPQMAPCVPGVDSVTAEGEERYRGRLRIKFGPISLNLQGSVTIQERDEENWRAVAHAEANDRRVGGGARINADMALIEAGPEATELVIHADARFLGKLGEFGEPVIRKQTNATIAAFARNVAQRFADGPPAAPGDSGGAPQAGGTPPAKAAAGEAKGGEPQPRPIPWKGKLIGLCIGIAIWLATPSTHAAGPNWLRMFAVTIALVVLGDLVERAIRRLRGTSASSRESDGNSSA